MHDDIAAAKNSDSQAEVDNRLFQGILPIGTPRLRRACFGTPEEYAPFYAALLEACSSADLASPDSLTYFR